MAMTAAGMSAQIVTQVSGKFTITDASKLKDFADAVAAAIVGYIQSNAAVSGTVTSGSGAGGAITGTVS